MDYVEIFNKSLDYFLKPIQGLLADELVTEVMINGVDAIYVERHGRIERTDARFPPSALEAAVRNILQYTGKRITEDERSYDARLPAGHRVHILLPPAARDGMCVTIRKFSKTMLTLAQLVERQALTPEAREYLEIAVLLNKNIVISGGTGSGKTTLLNCLSGVISSSHRVVVIEDSSELQLQLPHVVYCERCPPDRYGRGEMSIRHLVRASLRMRPDHIVIGEVRGPEALDLIRAMTSGHSGSLTTLHADHPVGALRTLETLSLAADVDLPLFAIRSLVAGAVDVIVQVLRLDDGSRRVTQIAEVTGIADAGDYKIAEVFRLETSRKTERGESQKLLAWTCATSSFSDELDLHDLRDKVVLTKHLFHFDQNV